jgi:hypothetical protein
VTQGWDILPRMDPGGSLRRAVFGAVATLLVGGGAVVLTATPAQAEDGLAQAGVARYVVSATGNPVRVEQVVTLTNLRGAIGSRSYSLTRYPLWLPNGASNLAATANGSPVSVSVSTANGAQFAYVTLPAPLTYGRSSTLRVTYAVKGAAPRSAAQGRVGKGYAAFDVYSPGDPGRATVQVVAPRAMVTDLGLAAKQTDDGDTRTTTAVGGGPFGLWSRASLRDPSQAAKSSVTVGSESFDVVGFPGDTAWSRHIARTLPSTVKALEKVAGQTWPSQTTTITEDLSGEVYGWDGSYDKGDIRVSEALDPALLAHELSHAFANHETLGERWLIEGLAQEMATEISAATKVKDRPHPTVAATQDGSFPLADWPRGFGVATPAEAYGYPASWRAVHELMAGAKPAARPALVRALTTKATVYDAPGEVTTASSPTTWRQAYDLFEVVGGNRQTRTIMTTWVVGSADAKAIAARGPARAAYAAADRLDGEWSLPRGVRTPMSDWDFGAATRAMAQVRDLAAPAVRAQQVAAGGHLDARRLRSAYQVADEQYEYQQVGAQLSAFLGSAGDYDSVRSDFRNAGPLTTLGAALVSPRQHLADAKSDIEDLQFADADTALADARSALGTARLVGTGVVGAGVLLLAVLLLSTVAAWRHHQRQRAQAAALGQQWVGGPAESTAEAPSPFGYDPRSSGYQNSQY